MKDNGYGKMWGHSRCILELEVTGVADGLRVKGVVREESRLSPGFLSQTPG